MLRLTLSLLLVCPSPPGGGDGDSSMPFLKRVLMDLAEGADDDGSALFSELCEQPQESLDALFATLDTGHLPECNGDAEGPCPHPNPGDQRRLAAALGGLPAHAAQLLANPEGGPTTAERVLALRILARTGDADDLHVAVLLATPDEASAASNTSSEEQGFDLRSVARALRGAVQGMLERDARTTLALDRAFERAAPALHSSLALAVGSVPSPEGMDLLVGELGRHPGLDVTLLSQMGRIAASHPSAAGEGVRMRVRSYLDHTDPGVRREACNIIGRIEDDEAIPALIRGLEDAQASVRRSAHWALGSVSRRHIRPDPDHWLAWYDEESRWWKDHGLEYSNRLRHPDPAVVAATLNVMSAKRLFRRELALEIEVVLDHPLPQIASMACSALLSLRSPASVPALVGALDHENADVRDRARRALVLITGLDLGSDAEAWRSQLASRG